MKLKADNNIRVDKYLMDKINISRSKIKKMIDNGNILVNEKRVKAGYVLRDNDEIYYNEDYDEKIDIVAQDIPLDIVYEDEYLLVVNKKSGMVVHPGVGNYRDTLVNALMYHCNSLSSVNGDIRPGIVHRIDADTSGLLLVAKNDDVHNNLAKQISDKTVLRKYIALVHGVILEDTATIDAPIGRSVVDRKKMMVTDVNAKEAITNIRVLERYKKSTLIECVLETGRTHQIRVHMAYINHPVVNDPVYGYKKLDDKDFGQMLHAETIGFNHPITGEYMEFHAELPLEFKNILKKYQDD